MPYRKYKPKTARKTPFRGKRKAKTYRRKNNIVRQPQVIADSTIVTLRYADMISLDPGSGSIAYDTWSCNNLHDPYPGIGGHQPLGFDQWSNFYQQYLVIGAKATFTVDTWGSAQGDSVVVVAKTSESSTWAFTDLNTLMEENKTKFRFLTSRTGSKNLGRVSAFYSPKKIHGIKDVRDNQHLRGECSPTSSAPTQQAYFHVGVGGMNPADNPTAVNCRVLIEYRVLFSERKDLGGS